MIHFITEIRKEISSAVTQVPVLIQYPDSKELPVVIVLETSNAIIRNRDDNVNDLNILVDTIDKKLLDMKIIRNGISHHNTTDLYCRQLSYRCEVLYNKKTEEYTIHNNN